MSKNNFNLTITCLAALIFCFAGMTSCVNSEQKEEAPPQKEESSGVFQELRNAVDELEKATTGNADEASKNSQDSELIHHSEIKKTLPKRLQGMEQTNYEGQTSGFAGLKISTSSAQYTKGDEKLDLSISDTGGLGMAILSMAQWSTLEVDKETSDGYERTTTWNGHKCYETYNENRKEAQLSVLIQDRLVVHAEAKNMSMDRLKRILEKMDFEDLLK